MGKVERMERVKCMSSFWGVCHPWKERGGCGRPGCESLRGMGSGILLVMYYTLRGLGKGVGVGVGVLGLSACQHSQCAKAGVGAGVGPLLSSTDLWENQRGFLLRCSASRQSPTRLKETTPTNKHDIIVVQSAHTTTHAKYSVVYGVLMFY